MIQFLQIQADPKAVRRFEEKINELIKHNGRLTPQMLKNITRNVCYFAYKATPVEKKTVVMSPPSPTKKDGHYVKADYKATPVAVKVRGRYFAKSGWVRTLRSLGKPTNEGNILQAKYGDISSGMTSMGNAWITFNNAVPYIEELNDGSAWNKPNNIMTKAVNQSRKMIENQLDKHGKTVAKKAGVKGR